jgi:hypothetical protein
MQLCHRRRQTPAQAHSGPARRPFFQPGSRRIVFFWMDWKISWTEVIFRAVRVGASNTNFVEYSCLALVNAIAMGALTKSGSQASGT